MYRSLRSNVGLLGSMLGDTMAESHGPEFLEKVERIRHLSKAGRAGDEASREEPETLLSSLEPDELAPVARAFAQFLNLANIAEQHHGLPREMDVVNSASGTLTAALSMLRDAGLDHAQILQAVQTLGIDELVLTAHPTEITRRSVVHKYEEINRCLGQLEFAGISDYERARVNGRLRELVALRNVYTDPLNVLQAELLARLRAEPDELTRQAVMITIAGVAAGMRNTG